jgi:hypothetical protein
MTSSMPSALVAPTAPKTPLEQLIVPTTLPNSVLCSRTKLLILCGLTISEIGPALRFRSALHSQRPLSDRFIELLRESFHCRIFAGDFACFSTV